MREVPSDCRQRARRCKPAGIGSTLAPELLGGIRSEPARSRYMTSGHRVSRRQFLVTSAVGFGGSLLALSAAAPALAATPVASVRAQQIPDVPRNRTLIMAGLGGEHYGGFTDLGNYTSFSPT